MSVRFRSDRQKWEASFVLRGRRKRILRDTKKAAQDIERDALKKRLNIDEVELERVLIEDAFKTYFHDISGGKTSRLNDRRYFNLAFHFFTNERALEYLDQITLQDLEALQKWLLVYQDLGADEKGDIQTKKAWTGSTVNRFFHTLNNFFYKMCAWGRLQKDPSTYLEALPEQSERRLPVTAEVYNAVMARKDAPDWFKDVLEGLYVGGLRASSLVRIQFSDLNFTERTIRYTSKKGADVITKVNVIPMTDRLFALFVRIRNRWPDASGPAFRYNDGSPVKADRISKVGNRLIKSCGFKNVDLYGTRHALASELTDAGVPTEVVRQLLGHANIRTTQRYAKGTKVETLSKSLTLVRGTIASAVQTSVPPDATNVENDEVVGGDSSSKPTVP